MILEELVAQLALRLTALERALKEKGFIDEAEVRCPSDVSLPEDLGEKIRALNCPQTLALMSQKREDKPWGKIAEIEARLTTLEAELIKKGGDIK